MRWSCGRKRAIRVPLIAAIPLEVTTASSVPSSTAIFAARACMQELHLGSCTEWLKVPFGL